MYYEKPLLTVERILETYIGKAPIGERLFIAAIKVWIKYGERGIHSESKWKHMKLNGSK